MNNKNHSKPSERSGPINYVVFNLSSVMMVWREREKLKAGPLSGDFYDGRSCRLELKGVEGQTQHFLSPAPSTQGSCSGCVAAGFHLTLKLEGRQVQGSYDLHCSAKRPTQELGEIE